MAISNEMIDFTKLSQEDLARVTTRDGRRVEIISTKGRGDLEVIGYIGKEIVPKTWPANGKYFGRSGSSPFDLILPPKPRVYYVNVYSGVCHTHASERIANARSSPYRLALYKIIDDGENATIEVIERDKG